MNFGKFFQRLLKSGVSLSIERISKKTLLFRLEKNGILYKVYYSDFGLGYEDDERICYDLTTALNRLESAVSMDE